MRRVESLELELVGDVDGERVRVGEETLLELGRQRGDPLVQRGELGATGVVKAGTCEHRDSMPAFEQVCRLGVEREVVSGVDEGLDPGEEPRIEADRVAVGGEARSELRLECVELVVGDRRARVLEHREHSAQKDTERSSATIVLSKVAGDASSAIASTSLALLGHAELERVAESARDG